MIGVTNSHALTTAKTRVGGIRGIPGEMVIWNDGADTVDIFLNDNTTPMARIAALGFWESPHTQTGRVFLAASASNATAFVTGGV